MSQVLYLAGSEKGRSPLSNPFSTCFIKPGTLPFIFNEGAEENLETVVDRFLASDFLGQIVGPHGTGKTTLTFEIEKRCTERFGCVRRLTFRNRSDYKLDHREINRELQSCLLIIDGVERLPWLHRKLMLQFFSSKSNRIDCSNRFGLLITTHKAISGVPTITRTQSSLELFIQIVERLAPNRDFDPALIKQCYKRHGPDIREAIMSLYDQA